MNRISPFLTAFLFFSFCGPTDAEIQSRINSAVEEALDETTTTTIQPPTTTTQTTLPTTTTTEVANVNYMNNIDENSFFLYFSEYRKTTLSSGDVLLQMRGYWNEARSMTLYFDDGCEIYEEFTYNKTGKSIGTLAINISEEFKNKAACNESSNAVSVRIMQKHDGKQKDTLYLHFLDSGEYFTGDFDATLSNSKYIAVTISNLTF